MKSSEKATFRNRCIRNALLVILMCTPMVCSKVANLYLCRELNDGKYFLISDLRQECYTAEHTSLTIIGSVLLFIYALGVPVATPVLILQNRTKLQTSDFMQK